ncbi:MAG: DUF1631 family protein, partial [Gammaproteobacteria bacterium]
MTTNTAELIQHLQQEVSSELSRTLIEVQAAAEQELESQIQLDPARYYSENTEAIQALKKQSQQLVTFAQQALQDLFNKQHRTREQDEPTSFDIAALTLVDEADIEENVALEGVARRNREWFSSKLEALRTALLALREKTGRTMNPDVVDPLTHTEILRDALKAANLPRPLRMSMYRHSEKLVNESLERLYAKLLAELQEHALIDARDNPYSENFRYKVDKQPQPAQPSLADTITNTPLTSAEQQRRLRSPMYAPPTLPELAGPLPGG